jgi:aryl-alcohol dehydrogenase-like predicted oxidoreductase
MDYRRFGRTGLDVSVIGFGGIIAEGLTQEEANQAVARAMDRGVNYFDFSPVYGDCEERLGPALHGKRDKVILACKTAKKDREGAMADLHRSLDRLRTGHFDIYQFHGVASIDALDALTGPGGAMEAMIEARDKGLIRYIGITVHHQDVALEALRRFDFDTVLFPINFAYWFKRGAGPELLEEAAKRNMGRAAMKPTALSLLPEGSERKWKKCWYEPIDDPEIARLSVRFTLSQDVHVAIPSGYPEFLEIAMDAAEDYKPLSEAELERLRKVASGLTPIF